MFEKDTIQQQLQEKEIQMQIGRPACACASARVARVGKKAETITTNLNSPPIKSGGYSKLAKQIFGGKFSANQD